MEDITLEDKILKDYQELEEAFRGFLQATASLVIEHPELRDPIDQLFVDAGISVKKILQKYGEDNHIKKLEVEDYQEQLMEAKRREVKANLQFKQVENAITAYNNARKGV